MCERTITIPQDRYQQLIQAEHDANHLKTLIADTFENYGSIDRTALKLLYTMYIGKKEEEEC